ncbi:CPBP family intramembrane metalloprotease [Ideonella azotifigens]|uniref:CAAX prenyl protease 2/Lysostaphin resistance protein A-like domain-containing protein n=1 Tax=Ideonella azotifigens TaxID=513160 RepID=A0ABN1KHX0_9BURK|nr:CPBP family intramembrane glutamic endopeptidase [Ideonella azotifigens]MCD2344928.1 CPBP family intramembrane metalloprotease [Ideonella azotifigens]
MNLQASATTTALSLRAPWRALGAELWRSSLVLAALFIGLRAAGTLGEHPVRWLLPLGFVAMTALPWLLLTAPGRRAIGLQAPRRRGFMLIGIAAGALAATLCFALGIALFGHGTGHWFTSVANSYRRTLDTSGMGLLQLHLIFTVPAVLFSPVGEELFFRGLLQRALEQRFSPTRSTLIEAGLFGLVHLCHHGLVLSANGLQLQPASATLWVLLMFATALLFAWLRRASDSLLPAIASHAAFNVTMNAFIFAVLWT